MAKNHKEETKRVAADIPKSLDERLEKVIPWGAKSEVVIKLLEAFADAAEKGGPVITHVVVQGHFDLVARNVQPSNTSDLGQ